MRCIFNALLFALCSSAVADPQHLYGPFFAADAARTSRLLVHNKRGDLPVTVTAYMVVNGTRHFVATIPLSPKESRTVTIDPQTTRAPHATGSIILEYDFFEPQAVDASVLVQHRNGARYVVPVFRRDQIRGTVQEAVILLPTPSARAFVALQNTSDAQRTASIDVHANAEPVRATSVTLAPGASEIFYLDAALARAATRGAAAIRVTNDGAAGDITAAGAVTIPHGRYAARIRFNDIAHGEHSRTLRAQFLLLGQQDASLGLPPGANFAAECALRNPTAYPKVAHARVKWLQNSTLHEASLPTIRLAPHEVRILDLTDAQQRGEIPAGFRIGAMEVSYEGEGGHLFGQLTSVDTTTGFTLDDSMTTHESHAIAGMEWMADEEHQTLISITNAARAPTRYP